MVRARLLFALPPALAGVLLLVDPVQAQTPASDGLFDMPLPGGVRAALAAIKDPVSPDRSQFLLDVIRRSYYTPIGPRNDPRESFLRALFDHLDAAAQRDGKPDGEQEGSSDSVPLPLPADLWIRHVFAGRATPQTLAIEILRTRNAALLYSGLMALDEDTRAWLATEPQLVGEIAVRHVGAFLLAAPAVRVSGGVFHVPGGAAAEAAWETVVGRRVNQPADFLRRLLAEDQGRLAYFFGALAPLTPPQLELALDLRAADPSARIAAVRGMQAVFARIAGEWPIETRTFWRPVLDPALLVADLSADREGRPILPGTRPFWTTVFGGGEIAADQSGPADPERRGGQAPTLAWICEQVFKGVRDDQLPRYQAVLFASRHPEFLNTAARQDAAETLRAVTAFPALVTTLERAGLRDASVFAAATRRAARLTSHGDDSGAIRALAQFQALLALLTRGARRGSLTPDALSAAVASLSAVDLTDRGDYEGRLVAWLDAFLRDHPHAATADVPLDPQADPFEAASGPMERDLLRLLAGRSSGGRLVDWEGTRYRVDTGWADAARVSHMLGENPRPYVTAARTLLRIAEALAAPTLKRADLAQHGATLQEVFRAADLDNPEIWEEPGVRGRYRDAAAALRRGGDVAGASRAAPLLRLLADDLLAFGLMELTYAAALGSSERTSTLAGEAARRHEFGFRQSGAVQSGPWRFAVQRAEPPRGWRVTGSLLGLDVKLSEFSLVRTSARPPSRRPSVNAEDRRVLVETVALVEPSQLTDADRDRIAAAIRKGRERLAAVRTAPEAFAIADEIQLGPTRRTLLPWVLAHEPDRVARSLSPSELLWLGLDRSTADPALDAWGAPGQPRLGCHCLQLPQRPWEMFAGRWNSGIFASAFPDLNLRLAELLAGLDMPASLLGAVLTSAMLDFVNLAPSRDHDDRRGLVEFLETLRPDRIEQYLALLTTDGPLVPTGETPAAAAKDSGGSSREGGR